MTEGGNVPLTKTGGQMASARDVANEFLRLAKERQRSVTPLQLMKLVYIAHGWMLGLYGRPLFPDRIEAWRYGPVLPDLYRLVKTYGADPIPRTLGAGGMPQLDETEHDLVGQVYERYGGMSGVRLSALTHQPGTPWAQSWNPEVWNHQIPNDLIQEHYVQLADGPVSAE